MMMREEIAGLADAITKTRRTLAECSTEMDAARLHRETFVTSLAEVKFFSDSQPGEFSGYGAFFNNVDSHGDIIAPGAFTETLAAHRARGMLPAMYAEHSAFQGGDLLPVGVWTNMSEDSQGLRVQGRLSGMETDHIKRVRSLMLDGGLNGLSIGFRVPPGGAVAHGKGRLLRKIDLVSVDVVRDPSNSRARVDWMKSMMAVGDHQAARKSVAAAIRLHMATLADAPTAAERAALLSHLQDAHQALTGNPLPDGNGGGKSNAAVLADLHRALTDFRMPRLA